MQSVDDALAVFERQVDGGVDMRANGVIVEILFRVKLVGEIRHAYTQFEGQSAVLAWGDGKVDKWIEGEHLAQLGRDFVVAEARIVEGEPNGRVVVKHFPTVLTVCVAVQRELEGGRMSAVTSQG